MGERKSQLTFSSWTSCLAGLLSVSGVCVSVAGLSCFPNVCVTTDRRCFHEGNNSIGPSLGRNACISRIHRQRGQYRPCSQLENSKLNTVVTNYGIEQI